MNKFLKWTIISIATGLTIFLGVVFYYLSSFFDVFEPTYTRQDLIDNYHSKSAEIKDLVTFVNNTFPVDKSAVIEFDGDGTLEIFHVTVNGQRDSNWDIKVKSEKTNILLKKLGLTQKTLEDLKAKLDNANCIAIETGQPLTIGFQRSGLGQCFYKVFRQNLNDSLKKQYNDSCQYIFYKDNIVLEYGGGAFGPQCFD